MYDRKAMWVKVIAWAMIVFTALIEAVAVIAYVTRPAAGAEAEVKFFVGIAAVVIVANGAQVLAKLWGWTVLSRITVQRQVKEVQVQLADLNAKLDAVVKAK